MKQLEKDILSIKAAINALDNEPRAVSVNIESPDTPGDIPIEDIYARHLVVCALEAELREYEDKLKSYTDKS